MRLQFFTAVLLLIASTTFAADVATLRVPDGGIQPQAVNADGVLQLIYYKNDPANGDIFYVSSKDGGKTFSKALQVNSQPGSAIAMGNIRGAHLAIGKSGRVHVAWMGSGKAEPRGPNKDAPMLYARLNDAGTAFEAQRNVIAANYGLDGGGTVAADAKGNVYVVWHGLGAERGEQNRRVWIARSTDDGKTFAPEFAALKQETGACGCCGIGAFADAQGAVHVLYRAATEKTDRGMYLLSSQDGATFNGTKLDEWKIEKCPMSSQSFSAGPKESVCAWENNGQVFFARIGADGKASTAIAAPGNTHDRKHPVVAENANGDILFAWTEGMGWQRGGKLSWQVFDKDGKPTAEKGGARGVPPWSLIAAITTPDGKFSILY